MGGSEKGSKKGNEVAEGGYWGRYEGEIGEEFSKSKEEWGA